MAKLKSVRSMAPGKHAKPKRKSNNEASLANRSIKRVAGRSGAGDILTLQRKVGNRAVANMIQRHLSPQQKGRGVAGFVLSNIMLDQQKKSLALARKNIRPMGKGGTMAHLDLMQAERQRSQAQDFLKSAASGVLGEKEAAKFFGGKPKKGEK